MVNSNELASQVCASHWVWSSRKGKHNINSPKQPLLDRDGWDFWADGQNGELNPLGAAFLTRKPPSSGHIGCSNACHLWYSYLKGPSYLALECRQYSEESFLPIELYFEMMPLHVCFSVLHLFLHIYIRISSWTKFCAIPTGFLWCFVKDLSLFIAILLNKKKKEKCDASLKSLRFGFLNLIYICPIKEDSWRSYLAN